MITSVSMQVARRPSMFSYHPFVLLEGGSLIPTLDVPAPPPLRRPGGSPHRSGPTHRLLPMGRGRTSGPLHEAGAAPRCPRATTPLPLPAWGRSDGPATRVGGSCSGTPAHACSRPALAAPLLRCALPPPGAPLPVGRRCSSGASGSGFAFSPCFPPLVASGRFCPLAFLAPSRSAFFGVGSAGASPLGGSSPGCAAFGWPPLFFSPFPRFCLCLCFPSLLGVGSPFCGPSGLCFCWFLGAGFRFFPWVSPCWSGGGRVSPARTPLRRLAIVKTDPDRVMRPSVKKVCVCVGGVPQCAASRGVVLATIDRGGGVCVRRAHAAQSHLTPACAARDTCVCSITCTPRACGRRAGAVWLPCIRPPARTVALCAARGRTPDLVLQVCVCLCVCVRASERERELFTG